MENAEIETDRKARETFSQVLSVAHLENTQLNFLSAARGQAQALPFQGAEGIAPQALDLKSRERGGGERLTPIQSRLLAYNFSGWHF